MSIVAIRCLRCGGPTVPTANPNEYNCQHCGFVSEFVRPADGTVVRDARTHHCPLCGRAVKLLQSFRCTECGTVDFCEHCVSSLPNFGVERFVCRACIDAKGWACPACGSFGASTCVNCRRRSCQKHMEELFGLLHQTREGDAIEFYSCANCQGELCADCLQVRRRLFSTKYYCPKCGCQVWRTGA